MKNHLAIFASGSGTNADAILAHFSSHPHATISLVVTNNPKAGVIDIAKKWKVPVLIVNKEQLIHRDYLLSELQKHRIDWIVLAGFMVMIPAFLVEIFKNKMVNIHPALLPKFGGKGMYGKHVHEAVIKAGEAKSGITIHYVTEEYDEGKIIFQQEVLLSENETAESLEKRIHALEHKNYPLVIEKLVCI